MKNSNILDLTDDISEKISTALEINKKYIKCSDKAKDGFPNAYATKTDEITGEKILYVIEHMQSIAVVLAKKVRLKKENDFKKYI